MEDLIYRVDINAPAKKVWETMLNDETYRQWSGAAWPNSFYVGQWKQGTDIQFTGPEGGGTVAHLIEVKPYERILAKHVAILHPGNIQDSESEAAKTWVGITEEYRFDEHNGTTTVTVLIKTMPEWKSMFNEGWPVAIKELKRVTETLE